jgi:hypothetical protein
MNSGIASLRVPLSTCSVGKVSTEDNFLFHAVELVPREPSYCQDDDESRIFMTPSLRSTTALV